MKKIFVSVLVLALAQMASAGVIELTIDGVLAPDEITLDPSDWIELDIDLTSGKLGDYEIGMALTGSDYGSLDFTDIAFPTVFYIPAKVGAPKPGYEVIVTASQLFNPPFEVPKVLVNGIMFHCDGKGTVTIKIVNVGSTGYTENFVFHPSYELDEVIDTLVIHQTPEPTTIALLGLGGLLLRRRRR